MSWCAIAARGSRRDSGKFHHHGAYGTEKHAGKTYRGWQYELVTFQSAIGVRRICYAASVSDDQGHRVAYLRDFATARQAAEAAECCIDQHLDRARRHVVARRLGSIPRVPA